MQRAQNLSDGSVVGSGGCQLRFWEVAVELAKLVADQHLQPSLAGLRPI
jgi:hypothetical protein